MPFIHQNRGVCLLGMTVLGFKHYIAHFILTTDLHEKK
jgi:hypothetical protein